ncbi:MAG: hypothetical protein ACOYME_00865 [Prochlorotrichaceae cyanobacterium]|jgi:hypothetical protein
MYLFTGKGFPCKAEKIAIVQTLKRSGSSVDFIVEITGLSVAMVEALE